ncbi:hypothetical protein EPYR_01859 [Erwinia pyrifoliae DSM 12163]|nr:hypothetical protein EPYR_01859 [Erwinia pyrifoliae DSM 12163]
MNARRGAVPFINYKKKQRICCIPAKYFTRVAFRAII